MNPNPGATHSPDNFHRAFLDSFPANSALLDESGTIIAVNGAWEWFARQNGALDERGWGVGVNYLTVTEATTGKDEEIARQAAQGIRAVLRGERSFFVLEYPCAHLDQLRWFMMQVSRMVGRGLQGALVAHIDITARKQAEEALRRVHADMEDRVQQRTAMLVTMHHQLQAEMAQRRDAQEKARRLEAELAHVGRVLLMQQMAAGIAHELNQPLSAVVTYTRAAARLLRGPTPSTDEVLEALDKATAQAERAGEILRRVRHFVNRRPTSFSRVDLRDVIHEALWLADELLQTSHIHVVLQLGTEPLFVHMDKVQIEQVLLNLIRNALEAMAACAPEERILEITLSREPPYVIVTVRDRGCGLAPEMADRLFQPFQTTKDEGLGLGLIICRSIIEAHGGVLQFASQAGHGATCSFTLPLGAES